MCTHACSPTVATLTTLTCACSAWPSPSGCAGWRQSPKLLGRLVLHLPRARGLVPVCDILDVVLLHGVVLGHLVVLARDVILHHVVVRCQIVRRPDARNSATGCAPHPSPRLLVNEPELELAGLRSLPETPREVGEGGAFLQGAHSPSPRTTIATIPSAASTLR